MGPAWGRSRLGPHDFFSYPSRSIPLREQTCTWGVVPAISQTGLQSKGPYNWAELTSPPRFPHAPPAPPAPGGAGPDALSHEYEARFDVFYEHRSTQADSGVLPHA